MNTISDDEPSKVEIQELSLLLENRSFVDYFNTFLCLPVFGQHVFFNFMEAEFEFEPPIKNQRHLYLDRREILKWLCTERFRHFKKSPLYTEFLLCMKLRSTKVEIPGLESTVSEECCDETGIIFIRNVLGTATGMLLFRESLRGTCGENVYRCWKDIEAWKLLDDPVKKMYWKHVIKTYYISQNSSCEMKSRVKVLAFQGLLNFDIVPHEEVNNKVLEALFKKRRQFDVDSEDALPQLQVILLDALQRYWLPRHLLHVLETTSKITIEKLKKPVPGDLECLSKERRLRCRFMFPTIYQDSSTSSPTTTVFVSKSSGDIPKRPPTPLLDIDADDDEDYHEYNDSELNPTDLLSLWGGPTKNVDIARAAVSSHHYPLVEEESADDVINRKLRSRTLHSEAHIRSPIPIVLKSYLGGRKRTLLGKFPKTTNRVIWSLASDILACCPFRHYLEKSMQIFDLQYLGFWTDVRNYLDTDEHAVNGFGHSLRRTFAQKIVDRYLSSHGEGSEIFSETLKMSIFNALTSNNDVSLICMAQDIVQETLWEPLRGYIQDERRRFLKQVRGHRANLDAKRRRFADQPSTSSNSADVDPMYFFNCAIMDSQSMSSATSYSPIVPSGSAMSRPGTSYNVSISEEQMWKAMEIAVLSYEYGSPMMLPQYVPKVDQLVDILYSDYGSLHVSRVPAVRNEWLRSLIEKPKINIETIRVSRKVDLQKVDLSAFKPKDKSETDPKYRARMTRRNGLIIDRPTKPKTFIEVLTTPYHFDFFKRFMLVNKASLPLLFWKSVEDLKDLSNGKTRQIRVSQIMRKFFGKFAKYGGALDCNEEIIRQIPNMEKVTPGILICAQAAVFRSMERKWYPQYLDTFPPDSETTSPAPLIPSIQVKTFGGGVIQNITDIALETQRRRKPLTSGKTYFLWKNVVTCLKDFYQATSGSKSEAQLLEIFLKCEVEREKHSLQKDQPMPSQIPAAERNMMMSSTATNVQTRVVIRNRLVIMNRLPADFRFWQEVKKYQCLVDTANQKGNISSQDTEFMSDKARSIIACYLASDILPRVQINIANDMAINIINNLASTGPTRGLFHDAIILLFPILYHYFRKFSEEWMNGDIPDDYLETIERTFNDHVSTTPHPDSPVPDFKKLKTSQFKTKVSSSFSIEEHMMRIHFSLSDGATLIYPQSKYTTRTSPSHFQGRRLTKVSLQGLHEEHESTRRGDKIGQGHGDRKSSMQMDGRYTAKSAKHGGKLADSKSQITERKISEKIIVKEESATEKSSEQMKRRVSVDKARKLSQLVENLNKEREDKVKEQNRKYSKLMSFDEVVSAAIVGLDLSEIDTNSVFS